MTGTILLRERILIWFLLLVRPGALYRQLHHPPVRNPSEENERTVRPALPGVTLSTRGVAAGRSSGGTGGRRQGRIRGELATPARPARIRGESATPGRIRSPSG